MYKMSMIDPIVLLWRSPSLFRWDRLIFEIYLLVDHSKMLVFITAFQIFFSVLNEVHQFLFQQRSSLV